MTGRWNILLIPLALVYSCRAPQAVVPPKSDLEMVIENKIGKDALVTKNRDGSFVLCKKQVENPSTNVMKLQFVIIRLFDKKVVEEGSVTMGMVEWSGDFEVEVSQAPGQAQLQRKPNATTRKIDLRKYSALPK